MTTPRELRDIAAGVEDGEWCAGEVTRAIRDYADVLERADAGETNAAKVGSGMRIEVTEQQVVRMVNRFLAWRLPEPWCPDNGISYTRPNYAHAASEHDWPTGTNLFDASQAREMILHMLGVTEGEG